MYTIEGICDWCQQPNYLTKHEYIDGMCHHSCEACNDLAVLDVRQFNIGEMQFRERNQQASL